MSLGLIIFLIILGLLLFIVEFMLIPGVTIAGIGGAVCLVTAIVFCIYELMVPQPVCWFWGSRFL